MCRPETRWCHEEITTNLVSPALQVEAGFLPGPRLVNLDEGRSVGVDVEAFRRGNDVAVLGAAYSPRRTGIVNVNVEPHAQLALHPDLPAVQLDELPAQGQPQAQIGRASCRATST